MPASIVRRAIEGGRIVTRPCSELPTACWGRTCFPGLAWASRAAVGAPPRIWLPRLPAENGGAPCQSGSEAAEQNAVAAQYEFMVDELNLERAVGTFYFMQDKEDRDAWIQRAVAHLQKRR